MIKNLADMEFKADAEIENSTEYESIGANIKALERLNGGDAQEDFDDKTNEMESDEKGSKDKRERIGRDQSSGQTAEAASTITGDSSSKVCTLYTVHCSVQSKMLSSFLWFLLIY